MQTENHEIEVEKGSGNIFADLGLEDADELLARSQIGFFVFKILEDKKLKQREVERRLGSSSLYQNVSKMMTTSTAACMINYQKPRKGHGSMTNEEIAQIQEVIV